MWGISLLAEDLLVSQEGLCSMEFSITFTHISAFTKGTDLQYQCKVIRITLFACLFTHPAFVRLTE
jgi:hypothetical protein